MYLNKAIIAGNLTREPELKSTQSGMKVCNFSVATNKSWKSKDGEKKEKTEYHNVICFDKTAEVIAKYFTKGKPIYIEGELQTSSWEDKETQKKMYKTEILLQTFQFNGGDKDSTPSKNDSQLKDEPQDNQFSDLSDPNAEELNPEEIPW